MNILLKSSVILTAAFLITGCGGQNPSQPLSTAESGTATQPEVSMPFANQWTAQQPSQEAATVDPDTTVVTVNNTRITEGQVRNRLDRHIAAQMKQMPEGMEFPAEHRQLLRKSVVDMLVDIELISQKLAEMDISVTDDQVTEALQAIVDQSGQTLADLEAELSQQGLTMTDVREQIQLKLKVDSLVAAEMGDATVSDEDARAFYDQNPQHFVQAEQVEASHILCGHRGISETEYPAQLEKIQAAQARLEAGESFADVARDVSTCPSGARGGELGFFGRGQMDPAFEKAAFAMAPDETSDIVRTSFGYHIIKVTDKRAAGHVPFEEVKDPISQHLTRQKQEAFWNDYNQSLRDDASIAYSPSEQVARDAATQIEEQMMMQQQMLQQQMMQ